MNLGKFARTRKNYKVRDCKMSVLTSDDTNIYIELQDKFSNESASLVISIEELRKLDERIKHNADNQRT